jgi:hypothetical protein
MADTWSITDLLRPRVRPEGLAPEPLRPQTRPEGLGTVIGGSIPESTQADATTPKAIPLDRTALIGLFHGPDGGTALLRLAGGSIVKVAAGETVDGGRVTAISQDGLRLRKDGEEILLTMPG